MDVKRVVALMLLGLAFQVNAGGRDFIDYFDPHREEHYRISLTDLQTVGSVTIDEAKGCPERTDLHCFFGMLFTFVVPREVRSDDSQEWTYDGTRYCARRMKRAPALLKVSGPVFSVWSGEAKSCTEIAQWRAHYLLSPTRGVLWAEYRREGGTHDVFLLDSAAGFGSPELRY
jgi:hypothetical protein